MAVVPRKRSGRIVYGVSTSWRGRKYWELVGPNRREAESVNARRLREVKAGTYRPGEITDAAAVATYAAKWLDGRRNRSADNDRALMTRHVISVRWFAEMRMADVRPRHVDQLVTELKAGTLSEKSVSIVMGLVRVMFRDAAKQEVIQFTPYMVERGVLKRSGVKRIPYTVNEARRMMLPGPEKLERERMWNTIAFFTGARCGEICGLRWGDWDENPEPLGALVIERQYDGEPLKTDRPRIVPVHPELHVWLQHWKARWSFYFLREPGPDDLIVPRFGHENAPIPLTKSAAYKSWLRVCEESGVTNHSVHSTRHTFITVARRNGADKEAVELVTHNPKGTIVDRYTAREWGELCAAVMCVKYGPPASIGDGSGDGPSPIAVIDGSRAWTRTSENRPKIAENEGKAGKQGNRVTLFLPNGADLDARVDARRPPSIMAELAAASDRAFRAKSAFWFRANRGAA